MRLTSSFISIFVLLGMLLLPELAHATGSGGDPGTSGADSGSATGGDVGSGEGTASQPPPASTGEEHEATAGTTMGATTGDTEGSAPPEDDKGCSIGSRSAAPGLLVLSLLGLTATRRRAR